MSLLKHRRNSQCQAHDDTTGRQCLHKSVGYRRWFTDGGLYHACLDHLYGKRYQLYIEDSPSPDHPATGERGTKTAPENHRR